MAACFSEDAFFLCLLSKEGAIARKESPSEKAASENSFASMAWHPKTKVTAANNHQQIPAQFLRDAGKGGQCSRRDIKGEGAVD